MPFERNPETGKAQFNFVNLLALVVIVLGFTFLGYSSFYLSKLEVKDNTLLTQTTTNVSNFILVVLTFFFGSSVVSAMQNRQIDKMHKDATDIALKTITSSPQAVELKVDKAVKIEQIKAALEKLDPESEEAKKLVSDLEELEKQS